MVLKIVAGGAILVGGAYLVFTNRDKISNAVRTDEEIARDEAREAEIEESGLVGTAVNDAFGAETTQNIINFWNGAVAAVGSIIPGNNQGEEQTERLNEEDNNTNPTFEENMSDLTSDPNSNKNDSNQAREEELIINAGLVKENNEQNDTNPRTVEDIDGFGLVDGIGLAFQNAADNIGNFFNPPAAAAQTIDEPESMQGEPEPTPAPMLNMSRSRGRGVFG